MNRSPLETANIAPPGGQFGPQRLLDDNSDSSDSISRTASGKDSSSWKHTNQYHLLHRYGYTSSQQPFPGALPFRHHSPFNMTHNSSEPTTSASQRFPRYGPQWQWYDLHQGGYGGSQMFPPHQFPQPGPSSPGAPRLSPGPLCNNPVNLPTSSRSTPPPGLPSSAPGRSPICLPTQRYSLSRYRQVRWYLGIIEERYGWCGRNCVTERRRCWKTWRKRRDGGGII